MQELPAAKKTRASAKAKVAANAPEKPPTEVAQETLSASAAVKKECPAGAGDAPKVKRAKVEGVPGARELCRGKAPTTIAIESSDEEVAPAAAAGQDGSIEYIHRADTAPTVMPDTQSASARLTVMCLEGAKKEPALPFPNLPI